LTKYYVVIDQAEELDAGEELAVVHEDRPTVYDRRQKYPMQRASRAGKDAGPARVRGREIRPTASLPWTHALGTCSDVGAPATASGEEM